MDLEKNKQRIEILAAELEELKRNGGGGGTPTESDDFTPDNITIEDGGTFPSGSTERLTKHLPLEINDTLYYFLEETGVDYLYGSLPTSGAFPTITYFRIMKGSFTVEFHQTAIETVPTEDSTNLITSGGVYTALQSAGGGDVIVDGDNVKTKNAGLGRGILIGNQAGFNSTAIYNNQIAIGTRAGIITPSGGEYPIAIGYQARGNNTDLVIGSNSANNGNGNGNTLVGHRIDARGSLGVGIGYQLNVAQHGVSIGWGSGATYTQNGTYVGFGCQTKTNTQSTIGQTAIGSSIRVGGGYCVGIGNSLEVNAKQVVLGRYNVESNDEDYFAIGNGTSEQAKSNLFSFSNNLFYCGNDTTGYDLRYFAPADETLADGGTISATALANALKHVPLSFNAHLCYYSYEDTNNVYYVSTRLNGASLHTNVVAINKTTGVATFNEFDQS